MMQMYSCHLWELTFLSVSLTCLLLCSVVWWIIFFLRWRISFTDLCLTFFQFISCICFNSCSRIHLHRISTFQVFILWYSIAFIAGSFCLTRFIKVYSSFNFLFNRGTWLIIVLLRCFVFLFRIWFTKFQVITVLVFIIITVFFIKFGSCARQWCCNCSTKLRIFRCIYNRFLKKRQNTDLYDAVNNLSIITKH